MNFGIPWLLLWWLWWVTKRVGENFDFRNFLIPIYERIWYVCPWRSMHGHGHVAYWGRILDYHRSKGQRSKRAARWLDRGKIEIGVQRRVRCKHQLRFTFQLPSSTLSPRTSLCHFASCQPPSPWMYSFVARSITSCTIFDCILFNEGKLGSLGYCFLQGFMTAIASGLSSLGCPPSWTQSTRVLHHMLAWCRRGSQAWCASHTCAMFICRHQKSNECTQANGWYISHHS